MRFFRRKKNSPYMLLPLESIERGSKVYRCMYGHVFTEHDAIIIHDSFDRRVKVICPICYAEGRFTIAVEESEDGTISFPVLDRGERTEATAVDKEISKKVDVINKLLQKFIPDVKAAMGSIDELTQLMKTFSERLKIVEGKLSEIEDRVSSLEHDMSDLSEKFIRSGSFGVEELEIPEIEEEEEEKKRKKRRGKKK